MRPKRIPEEAQALLELTAIFENAAVGIVFTSARTIQRCNRRVAEIFGYKSLDELVGKPARILHPDAESHERLGRQAAPRLAAGQAFRSEWLLRRADGSPVWINLYGKAVDPADTEGGTVWILEDVTEAKRTKEDLDRNLRALDAILQNAPVGIAFTQGRHIVRCNARFREIYGLQVSGLGLAARELYRSDEEYEALGRVAAPLLSQGKPFQTELFMRRGDGTDIWVNLIGYVQNLQDPSEGTIWIGEDRTAIKQGEEALRRAYAEQKLALAQMEAIMKNAPVGICFTRDRRILRYNPKFAETFGFRGEEGIGIPGRAIYRSDEEYASLGRTAGPLLSRGKPVHTELYMRRQDGADLWINLIAYVQDPEDPAAGTFWILEDRTAFKNAEEALQRAYSEQQLVLDHSVVGIAFIRERRFQRVNRRMEEIYGYAPGELDGQSTRVIFPSDENYERMGTEVYTALARGGTYTTETILQNRSGQPFWVRATGKAIDPARPQEGSIWNYEDVTASKVAEDSLRESETLQRAILESASLLILSTDPSGVIISCNSAAESMLGVPASELIGHRPTEAFLEAGELEAHRQRLRREMDLDIADPLEALLARPRLGRLEEGEWNLRRGDGAHVPVQLAISPLREGHSQVKGFLLVAGDITERKRAEEALKRSRDELEVRVMERTAELEAEVGQRRRAEERLKYLALHDGLTGLPNRTLLHQRMVQTVAQRASPDQLGAVLFIDLDRFKNVNDTLGHHVGDALLKEAARRIAAAVRAGDTVARLGGDEFVVIAGAVEDPRNAQAIAEKIRDHLLPAIRVNRHELFTTPSIGIALYPRDGTKADLLLQNADTAMYQAKAAGRNAIRFFDRSMAAAAEKYLRTESSLRRGLSRGEFEAHYQPLVDLATRRPVALELLVRWHHPERGIVMPGHFIPIAEETGLVGAIGTQVLESGCRQLRAWRSRGIEVPKLCVNLSALQFRDENLIASISAILAAEDVPVDRIEFEITETALMQDGEQTLATLQALASAGFGLSVDDFGTGYSSLAYLKRFPVSCLKIDRSFITDMAQNADDEAIVRTIIALGKALRLSITAEGVETAEQCEALHRLGCDQAQGYYFARPMPAALVEAYLTRSAKNAIG